jgi:hypothetical protein
VPALGIQVFVAIVVNNANPNVSWSVDGIPGGNVTVGTINAGGVYSAPAAGGSHTVTATSVADPTKSGSAAVLVTGSAPVTGDVLTDDIGNIIYLDGNPIYVE